jgi:hypothetical protein
MIHGGRSAASDRRHVAAMMMPLVGWLVDGARLAAASTDRT